MDSATATRLSIALCLSLSCAGPHSAPTPPADSTPQAAKPAAPDSISTSKTGTKLAAFQAKTGTVVIGGFSRVGVLIGLYGSKATIDAKEFTDASNGSRQLGITVNVKEAGTLERDNTSYVDYDELDGLLRGLDYIAKVDKSVTRLHDFQADFRTRGDLAFSTFSSSDGTTLLAVKSGNIGGTNGFFVFKDIGALRQYLASAKSILDSLPPPASQ